MIRLQGSCSSGRSTIDSRAHSDSIEIHVHQAESSCRDEYVLRPFIDPAEEVQSVRFFFDVFRCILATTNGSIAPL